MTTVYQYRIFCETDSKWEYTWGTSEPTKCPTDTGHTVNIDSVSEIDSVSNSIVEIKEEDISTGKNFRVETRHIIAPPGQSDHVYSWKYPISVMNVKFRSNDTHNGDVINNELGKNTIIGTLTTQLTAGSNIIYASNTAMTTIKTGYYVTITDGNTVDDMGFVVSKGASLVMDKTATNNYTAGAYIRQTVMNIKDFEVGEKGLYELGVYKIGASYLPANVTSTVTYTNNGTGTKDIIFSVEYLY